MTKITGIHQNKVDQQTIELLEDLLAKAKTGELQSLIYIDGYRNQTVGHGWAGVPTIAMIGEMEHVKFDFFSQMYFPMEGDAG